MTTKTETTTLRDLQPGQYFRVDEFLWMRLGGSAAPHGIPCVCVNNGFCEPRPLSGLMPVEPVDVELMTASAFADNVQRFARWKLKRPEHRAEVRAEVDETLGQLARDEINLTDTLAAVFVEWAAGKRQRQAAREALTDVLHDLGGLRAGGE